MTAKQKQRAKKRGLHWRVFMKVGKDPSDPTGIRTMQLPEHSLFNAEGQIRGYARAKTDGSWITAVGFPSVEVSNVAATVEEAKQHVLDTLEEWGLEPADVLQRVRIAHKPYEFDSTLASHGSSVLEA